MKTTTDYMNDEQAYYQVYSTSITLCPLSFPILMLTCFTIGTPHNIYNSEQEILPVSPIQNEKDMDESHTA